MLGTLKPQVLQPWYPIKLKKVHKHFWEEEELTQFIRYLNELWAKGPEDRERSFFCRALVYTAARIHELTYVQLRYCYEKSIYLEKTKANRWGEVAPRTVGWFPEFQPFYDEFLAERRIPGEIWLFPQKRRRLTKSRRLIHAPQSMELSHKWWNAVVDGSGVRRLTSHQGGRKTGLTWMSEVLDRQNLQDQAGHADFHTTDTIYRGSIAGRRFVQPFPTWRIACLEPYPELHAELLKKLKIEEEI